jgi:hypothetical protein
MEKCGQIHVPDRFTHGTHWIGDWLGSRAGLRLNAVKNRQILLLPEVEPRFLGHSASRFILWYVDPLLGGDREIGDCTVGVARQRPANNKRGMVFSARAVQRRYKQDNWNNELVAPPGSLQQTTIY